MPGVSIFSSPSEADLSTNSFYMTPGCPLAFSYTDVSVTTMCNYDWGFAIYILQWKTHPLSYSTGTMDIVYWIWSVNYTWIYLFQSQAWNFTLCYRCSMLLRARKNRNSTFKCFLHSRCHDSISYPRWFENCKHGPHYLEKALISAIFWCMINRMRLCQC